MWAKGRMKRDSQDEGLKIEEFRGLVKIRNRGGIILR